MTFSKGFRPLIGILLLAALMVLAACGGGASDTATATPAAPADAVATPAPAGEQAAPAAVAPGTRAGDIEPAGRNGMYPAAPAMMIDPAKYYYTTLATDKGDIRVQLFADRAPIAVNNFVFLAEEGYYDNTTFHRVLDGFMAQGGDPTGSGAGGPGYTFADEFVQGLEFDRPGLLAMANAGPATNGSQFFITFGPTPHLNGLHTIFGEVIQGQDVLDNLTRRDPQANPTEPGDTLLRVTIEESDSSSLPTPEPTPTPLPTPTPFAPSSLDAMDRPLAAVPAAERANFFNTAPETTITTGKIYTATIIFEHTVADTAALTDTVAVTDTAALTGTATVTDTAATPTAAVTPGVAVTPTVVLTAVAGITASATVTAGASITDAAAAQAAPSAGVTRVVTVALFADVAPVAVNNFVTLARLGFYDGTPVNISNDDLVVIGSPDDSLERDAGYRILPEVSLPQAPAAGSIAWAPEVQTEAGLEASGSILMMAKTEPPAQAAASYSFFGRVVSGLDALSNLQQGDLIQSITVTESK